MLGWGTASTNIWCADPSIISDTEGGEPDITLESCQQRCLNEASCNFMFFGIESYSCRFGTEAGCAQSGVYVNRCALFETCDERTTYLDGNPSTYQLIRCKENDINMNMLEK